MLAVLITVIALVTCSPIAADILTRPAQHQVGAAPADLTAERFILNSAEGETLAGWLVRGRSGLGAVLLLHGLRADRRDMTRRALFLNSLGYTVLCLDLPGHGESSGRRITFGLREARGVDAALDYLANEFPLERIGVIGVSLGGAALLLGAHKHAPSAVVLESVFPTFNEAMTNRMHEYLGPMTIPLAWLLTQHMPARSGVSADQLRPIDAIKRLEAPVLIISGGKDRHTTPDDTARLFEAAQEPKDYWIVDGAAHVDLYDFRTSEYESRIRSFFGRYLRGPAEPSTPISSDYTRAAR